MRPDRKVIVFNQARVSGEASKNTSAAVRGSRAEPEEGHMTCVSPGNSQQVREKEVKVALTHKKPW